MFTYPTYQSPSCLFRFGDFSVELCLHPHQVLLAQRFRYQAFLPTGTIKENPEHLFQDEYDDQPNSRILLVYYQGKPVGTIRNLIYAADYAWTPSYISEHLRTEVEATIGKGTPFLESGRFAIHPELSGKPARTVQGLLFRAQTIAASVSGVGQVLTLVKPSHTRFYERYMGFRVAEGLVETDVCPCKLLAAPAWQECRFPYAAYDFLGIQKAAVQQRYLALLFPATPYVQPDKAA